MMNRKLLSSAGAFVASMLASSAAWAQEGPIKAPTAEQMAGMVDKGDTSWMLICSALVLMMSIPGLALFYGGLVRAKKMARSPRAARPATRWPSHRVVTTTSSAAFPRPC